MISIPLTIHTDSGEPATGFDVQVIEVLRPGQARVVRRWRWNGDTAVRVHTEGSVRPDYFVEVLYGAERLAIAGIGEGESCEIRVSNAFGAGARPVQGLRNAEGQVASQFGTDSGVSKVHVSALDANFSSEIGESTANARSATAADAWRSFRSATQLPRNQRPRRFNSSSSAGPAFSEIWSHVVVNGFGAQPAPGGRPLA